VQKQFPIFYFFTRKIQMQNLKNNDTIIVVRQTSKHNKQRKKLFGNKLQQTTQFHSLVFIFTYKIWYRSSVLAARDRQAVTEQDSVKALHLRN